MQGVVLAAGEGTRLRPLTAGTPKALLDVGGRPLLTRCFERLVDLGVTELVVVVGYEGERIRERYGESFSGVPIGYAVQHERDGMAHALLAAEEHVDGPFVLMDGDGVVSCDLDRLVERQRDPEIDGTILVDSIPASAAREKMVCVLDDCGELVGWENKPQDPPDPSLVAASVQTATPALLNACRRVERSPRGEFEMSDAIGHRLADGARIVGVRCDGWVVNVNTPADLTRASELVGKGD